MSKVTVIIPTYQHELFIRDCLKSLIEQSFSDWEAIVVDDGSSDRTADIISEFVNRDSRINYYFQENKGIYRLSELYNFALSKASGEFIAVLEGDDYWPIDKLSRQIQSFNQPEVGLVWGDGKLDTNCILSDFPGYRGFLTDNVKDNNPVGCALPEFIFNSNFFRMPTCSVMFRTSTLLEVGGFYQPEGLPWLDKSTWALVACVAEFRYLPETLGIWRRHDSQVTQNNSDIRGTFDFVFSDLNCPKLLTTNIVKFKSEFELYSALTKFYRSRKLIHFAQFLFRCMGAPIVTYKLARRLIDLKHKRI
jgi:glycosyltransferase involved in cell wall biosynthesis